jgi:3-deoxy-D-arabino-heptulosonate 7-phosphate (DAHP) synthase
MTMFVEPSHNKLEEAKDSKFEEKLRSLQEREIRIELKNKDKRIAILEGKCSERNEKIARL